MLTPGYLQTVPDPLIELYGEAEAAILEDMARRINGYDMFIPAAQHQMRMLEEMGALREEIMGQLSKLTGKSTKELERIMREAGMRAVKADDMIYKAAGLAPSPLSASKEFQRALATGLKQTKGLFTNLTRTTALAAGQQFEQALDLAYMEVYSGAFSPQEAVRKAVQSLCQQGVTAVNYRSGHRDSMDVAVRRAVITGVNQTAMRMQMARADELNVDLVETTAHAGARPSHAEWQGQIFSRSGKSARYPDFVQVTGYGTGAGLGGWNCSHSFRPYFEGMPRAYTEEILHDYTAAKYEYNGKPLTEYEALQQQRYIERNIRRWKRENTAMRAAGLDTTESATKLAQWQNRRADFLDQTGLKRQADLETIAGWGRSDAARASAEARKAKEAANSLFSLGNEEANLRAYLKEKPVIDKLASYGVKYRQRISGSEIIVDAGKPTIAGERNHAVLNCETKPDRAEMTIDKAQCFVNNAKLTLYQEDRNTLKFLADTGYAILNLDHHLVTAVPQKWRRKYDKYL